MSVFVYNEYTNLNEYTRGVCTEYTVYTIFEEYSDVDIHLHILPATRQPRRPSLYIGTIPGNGRL